jgi:predicted DNA-binding transcriptional regulator YafY
VDDRGDVENVDAKDSKAERMLNLLVLLNNTARPLTLDEICEKMRGQYPDGPSRRTTFERDKSDLRSMGVPIAMVTLGGDDAGRAAYFIDKKGYGDLYIDITPEELRALQFAAAMVQIEQSWGRQAVLRLGGELVDPPMPTVAHVPADSEKLPELWLATKECHPVEFEYHGKMRRVHPYCLQSRNGFWYVSAHDTARDAVANYRVDRISSAITVVAKETFERPAGFSASQALPSDPKTFEPTDETALVRIDATLAPVVSREVSPNDITEHHPDGSITVRVPCGHRPAFRTWLFAMVDRAEVLAPASLRNEVVSWLRDVEKVVS